MLKLWYLALFLTEIGLKNALSKNIEVVLSEIPESIPPKIPARHSGFFESEMVKSLVLRVLSMSSRVLNFISFLYFFTLIVWSSIFS